MRPIALIAALTLAHAPLASVRGEETSPEVAAALRTVNRCLVEKVIKLDDTVSHERTIAQAAINACAPEIDELGRAEKPDRAVTDQQRTGFRETFGVYVLDATVEVVKQFRPETRRYRDEQAAKDRSAVDRQK